MGLDGIVRELGKRKYLLVIIVVILAMVLALPFIEKAKRPFSINRQLGAPCSYDQLYQYKLVKSKLWQCRAWEQGYYWTHFTSDTNDYCVICKAYETQLPSPTKDGRASVPGCALYDEYYSHSLDRWYTHVYRRVDYGLHNSVNTMYQDIKDDHFYVGSYRGMDAGYSQGDRVTFNNATYECTLIAEGSKIKFIGWKLVDKDSDGDGIYDSVDNCPFEPGPAFNNGCPLPQPPSPIQQLIIWFENLINWIRNLFSI